ncbi:uncharacterized protein LOC131936411 [Physella acuta]|uniref:uncharacterized protein LOC131936411 n=1 Tax=Physella acuta TaxID=109671 RepID=UPI0027DD8E54|nr:uncharacterized protein LOC131936411 [Physella acuta]XP_059149367.1 uncharacterized protein LOC131936411 [Physella acuta]
MLKWTTHAQKTQETSSTILESADRLAADTRTDNTDIVTTDTLFKHQKTESDEHNRLSAQSSLPESNEILNSRSRYLETLVVNDKRFSLPSAKTNSSVCGALACTVSVLLQTTLRSALLTCQPGTITESAGSKNPPKNVLTVTPFHTNMASVLPDITGSQSSANREIIGPKIEWDEENVTLAEITDKDNFPCVCCFEESIRDQDGKRECLPPGLKIYSRQPVLMQMKVNKLQARARTIIKDPKGAFYEVGQTLIIPVDYLGWFELVPSDFRRAECFMSIADVAKAMPKKFFTRSNVKGIRVEGEGEAQKYLERKVPAGSVLQTTGLFTATWKTVAQTGLLKKKTKEWETQEVTYLKCVDLDGVELMIPLTHKGKFNAIYEKGQVNLNAVYSVKDVLSDLTLPIKVRLLFGKAPVVPCIFTGMLVIRTATIDESLVGSTIINTRNVLFELPVTSPVQVKYLSNDEPLRDMKTYTDAQKLCKKYSQVYSTMIKLAPDLDTDQKVIMHVPSDPEYMRQVDESLRALDLITDISLTGEPRDYLLDSDAESLASDDKIVIPPRDATTEFTAYKSRESTTFV